MTRKDRQSLVNRHIESAKTGQWGEAKPVVNAAVPALLRAGVSYKPIFDLALAKCSPTAQISYHTFKHMSNQAERDIRKNLNKWFLAI